MSQLMKAVIVYPFCGLIPNKERAQRPGETMIEGKLGWYFISKISRSYYSYEYFGDNDLKSGAAYFTKADTLKFLRARLAGTPEAWESK